MAAAPPDTGDGGTRSAMAGRGMCPGCVERVNYLWHCGSKTCDWRRCPNAYCGAVIKPEDNGRYAWFPGQLVDGELPGGWGGQYDDEVNMVGKPRW